MILSRIGASIKHLHPLHQIALKGIPTRFTQPRPGLSSLHDTLSPGVSSYSYSTNSTIIIPPTISPKASETNARRRALLTFLLRPVRLHLSSHNYDLAVHTFRTRTLPRIARQPNPSTFIRNAYISLLRSLLLRRAANPALALYTSMTSLYPDVTLPRLLKAQLDLSVSTTLEPANVTGHRRVLTRAVSGIGFTPEDMLALARFLAVVLRWRPTHIGRAILDYLSTHPAPFSNPEGGPTNRTNDKYRRIYAHLSELVQNPAVLERLVRTSESKSAVNTRDMTELPTNSKPDHIRAWLGTRGVAPDAATLASLIELQYSRGRYDRACALYGLFTASSATEEARLKLLPPASATRAMYNVIRACSRAESSQPRSHLSRQERFPLAEDVPSLRTLFHNMLHAHQTQTSSAGKSNALSAAALHTALREFLREGDYAGAYVALRTFSLATNTPEITPGWTTWRVVVQAVAGRVQAELAVLRSPSRPATRDEEDLFVRDEDRELAPDTPPPTDSNEHGGKWLDRLLGPLKRELALFQDRSPTLLLAFLVLRLSHPLPTRIRNDDENARVDPDALVLIPTPPPTPETLSHSVTPDHGFVPSPKMLIGEQAHPLPAVRKWDIRPLERLVLRVLDADIEGNMPEGVGWKEVAKEKARLIKEAKREMIPLTGVRRWEERT